MPKRSIIKYNKIFRLNQLIIKNLIINEKSGITKMDNENFAPPISMPKAPQKRKGSNFVEIIAVLIILGIVGVGTSLATRVWDPLWNPFRPEPKEVLTKMVGQMKELKTYYSKATFAINLKNKKEFKIAGDFSGDNDTTNPDNPKSAGKFNLNFAMEGMQFSLAGEAKTIGEISYFKLTTIPALPMLEPFFALMGIDLQQFKNQWVKFDQESIKEIFPSEMTKEFEKESEKQKKEQKEIKEKIKKLIANKELYFPKKELADEKIGKIKAYHYIVALNKEEIKKLIPELMKIVEEREKIPIEPEGMKEFQEKFDELLNKIGEITADIWIGKKDFHLYKLNLEKEIDLSVFETEEKGKITIKLATEFDKFNQPIEITAPEEFKTIKEILTPKEGLLFGPFESARSKARDARRQADIGQIMIALEMYCSDKDSCPQSKTIQTLPKISYLDYLPTDPGNGPCSGYIWINNVGYPQKFCLYACLENGEYSIGTHKGYFQLSSPPKTLEDCEKKVSIPSSGLKFPFDLEKNSQFFIASLERVLSGILRK